MELNEQVTVDDISGAWKCHFPHEKKPWPAYANDFRGNGGTLGDKMASGEQTIINKEMGGGAKLKEIRRPKEDNKSNLYGKDLPVKLGGLKPGPPKELPLTCAAHHLIPAQASLRDSAIAVFLFEGSADFSEGKETKTKGGGLLEANVGYDVNGQQNGIWLPGPYALKKGKKESAAAFKKRVCVTPRTKQTKEVPTFDVEMIEDPSPEDQPPSGLAEADVPTEYKIVGSEKVPYYFLYTVSAMLQVGAQYHDAHPDYSKFVVRCLNRIATEMYLLAYTGLCPECPKRKEGDKLPPPYDLVLRLNGLSRRLAGYLVGHPSGWRPNVWTSKVCVLFGRVKHQGLTLQDVERAADLNSPS